MTLTEETGATLPSPQAWTVPLWEDMFHHGRTGLNKAVVMGASRVLLLSGRWSLGEGLSLCKARDTLCTLTGARTWVVKTAYVAADPLTIQEV